MLKPMIVSGLALAALSGCDAMRPPALTEVDGLPFINYRCADFSLAQVAFDRGRSILQLGAERDTVDYISSDEVADEHLYIGERRVMIVGDDDIFLGPRVDTGAGVQPPTLRCSYESGG